MNKKDKFYLLIFIFSISSMLVSIILKLFGIDWFYFNIKSITLPIALDYIIKFFVMVLQYILIVGCVIKYEFKKLFLTMIPYIPLNILLDYFPQKFYSVLCILVLFITCITIEPKFSTVVRFIINILFILNIQLIILWIKLDIKSIAAVFPDAFEFLILNIDQFIILFLLYFIQRKWGGKYGLDFLRQKKEKIVSE